MTVIDDRPQLRKDVARLVAEAYPNKQIAGKLGVSERTVKRMVDEIGRALQLDRTKNLRVQIALRVLSGTNVP